MLNGEVLSVLPLVHMFHSGSDFDESCICLFFALKMMIEFNFGSYRPIVTLTLMKLILISLEACLPKNTIYNTKHGSYSFIVSIRWIFK